MLILMFHEVKSYLLPYHNFYVDLIINQDKMFRIFKSDPEDKVLVCTKRWKTDAEFSKVTGYKEYKDVEILKLKIKEICKPIPKSNPNCNLM